MVNRDGRLVLALAASVAALLVVSCRSATPEQTLSPVSSFHYRQTMAMTFDGQTLTSHDEAYYQAPDSIRVLSDSESPYLEMILIGPEAWTRDRTGWSRTDPESIWAIALANSLAVLDFRYHKEFEDMGPGPTIAAEPTRRYRLEGREFSSFMTEHFERLSSASPECAELLKIITDPFKNADIVNEMTLGEKTDRVYSLATTFVGPQGSGRIEMSIDQYNVPVSIEPPRDVPVRPAATGAPWPCPT